MNVLSWALKNIPIPTQCRKWSKPDLNRCMIDQPRIKIITPTAEVESFVLASEYRPFSKALSRYVLPGTQVQTLLQKTFIEIGQTSTRRSDFALTNEAYAHLVRTIPGISKRILCWSMKYRALYLLSVLKRRNPDAVADCGLLVMH
jgi:hypothetical protein